MTTDNPHSKPKSGGADDPARTVPGRSKDKDVDMKHSMPADADWVADSLRKLYTSTIEEGIPADMLALLDQLDEAVTPERRKAVSDDDAGEEGTR